MNAPTWSTGDVTVTDPRPDGPLSMEPFRVLHVRTVRPSGGHLHVEAVRSLKAWLDWWLHDWGGTPPAAEWERIRGPIADARLTIRQRSEHPDCTEDERAGLAVAENVLRRLDDAEREARRAAEVEARAAR